MNNEMDNAQKTNTQQGYEYASAISLACIVAIIVAVIGFGQDLELKFRKEYLHWILKIPEWTVLLVSCGCWCAIFLGIGDYCKKFFNLKSSLFAVLAGLEFAIFLSTLFIEDSESFAVLGLYFLVAIAHCVILFIAGIQMNKTQISKYVPTAFIVYAVMYLVLILLLPAIIIDVAIDGNEEVPVWVTVGSLLAELVPLYLINKVFSKMEEKEDLEERKDFFNNNTNE